MVLTEYNSNARQLQVYSILKTLRIEKSMSENEITTSSEGLTKVLSIVEELSPQCRPHFWCEAHKFGYLRDAFRGLSWAKLPIGNIVPSNYTFNGFITALREGLQL
ncbi:hypothetical protein BWQ96_09548 [Gracilariopsis chorda]|uniref:Uncharacterized protein n=1 Tax=Gracilariopsis chorda TaxID=448386 RepID=A0A2V3IF51_9FLOR|nr:hypothetical protein BWQ96_09548 [Gracilariopsis chorda]|eukprot:PXF40715.1 hypothetical protein BWQ96_09548 [Gracilariopsis chorda]